MQSKESEARQAPGWWYIVKPLGLFILVPTCLWLFWMGVLWVISEITIAYISYPNLGTWALRILGGLLVLALWLLFVSPLLRQKGK